MSMWGYNRGSQYQQERSQIAIIGIVLLIGIVAIGSLGILWASNASLSQIQHQAEHDRIEQSFVELSQSISSVAAQNDIPASADLEAGDYGAIAHHDSAKYEIWAEEYGGGNRTDIGTGSIGTIEYVSDDGTKIAFEGGGVFHETGERTQIVSPPPISYNRESSTLSFPVITLTEGKELDSGGLVINHKGSKNNGMDYVQNDHLFVEIRSKYCLGWEQYFERQAGDTSIQQECYGGENDEGVVKAKLGYEEIENAFQDGVAVPDHRNYNGPSGNSPHGNIEMNEGDFQPITETIESLRNEFSDYDGLKTTESNSGGEYYVEEMNGSYDFELSGDNAIVVVDGDVSPDKIDVSDCGEGQYSLRVYAMGDFDLSNDVIPSCSGGSVDTIQLYGTHSSSVVFQDSSSTFRGLIYVASDNFESEDGSAQVEIKGAGNVDIQGSIIAHSVDVNSAANSVYLEGTDNSNVNVIPEGHEPAPQLTYLNIVEHEVSIDNN